MKDTFSLDCLVIFLKLLGVKGLPSRKDIIGHPQYIEANRVAYMAGRNILARKTDEMVRRLPREN